MCKAVPLGRAPELSELNPRTRAKIEVDENGCWIWQGVRWYGYGPHLRLYQRYVGMVPKGHDLHHVCRNGPGGCCNPSHLKPVDAIKHRTEHARESFAKLTLEDAAEIRRLMLETMIPADKIGARYGVQPAQIERLANGLIFKELGGSLVYTRTCGWCGVTFETDSRRKRYCCTTHQKWIADRQKYLRNRGTDSTHIRPKRSRRQAEEARP